MGFYKLHPHFLTFLKFAVLERGLLFLVEERLALFDLLGHYLFVDGEVVHLLFLFQEGDLGQMRLSCDGLPLQLVKAGFHGLFDLKASLAFGGVQTY